MEESKTETCKWGIGNYTLKAITYFVSILFFSITILSTGCEQDTEIEPGNINGYWSRGDIVVFIQEGVGVFHEINSGNWYEALNNGIIHNGDSKFISISRVSKNTFSAREMWSRRVDGEVVEVGYGDAGDLTLSEDGSTLSVRTPNPWYENTFSDDTYQKVIP